jgi:hypothetical protein
VKQVKLNVTRLTLRSGPKGRVSKGGQHPNDAMRFARSSILRDGAFGPPQDEDLIVELVIGLVF